MAGQIEGVVAIACPHYCAHHEEQSLAQPLVERAGNLSPVRGQARGGGPRCHHNQQASWFLQSQTNTNPNMVAAPVAAMLYWSFSVPFVAGIALMSLVRTSNGLAGQHGQLVGRRRAATSTPGTPSIAEGLLAPIDHAGAISRGRFAMNGIRAAPRFAVAVAELDDVCTTPFKHLLGITYPPLLVGGPGMLLEQTIQGVQFPKWQPIDTPFIPNRLAWAQVDEFRITVHRSAVLLQGWPSPADFVASWIADMGAAPERPVASPERLHSLQTQSHQQPQLEPTEGSKAFNSRLVFEKNIVHEYRVPGGVLRADLHDPTSGGELVRTMDSEIVEIGNGFFCLASISCVGDDGVPRRNPLNGVRELGYFEGEGAAWTGAAGQGNEMAKVTAGDSSRPATATIAPSKDGLVTFYTRAIYSVDGGDDDADTVRRVREAWSGFIRGIGERFGMASRQATSALRGLGGYERVFGFVRERPSCFTEQVSDSAELHDVSGDAMRG